MDPWEIEIENVAGIRAGEATIHPGINTIRAENWRGKSSFIAAVETAMGTAQPLTEGQERGTVRLETDEGTAAVELARTDGGVVSDGEPYLENDYDQVRAALYAFLDSTNEVRAAVRRGENLEAVLTRPLDFENLDERIASLREEREQVTTELDRAQEAADRLPSVEEAVRDLETQLESLRDRRDELQPADGAGDVDDRDALSDARAERDRVAARIERLEASLERAESTLADRRAALESLEATDVDDVSDELEDEHEELSALERDLDLLQSVYAVANRLQEAEGFGRLAEVEHGLVDDTVTCLLCGNAVEGEAYADHLAAVGERVAELRESVADRRERIEELQAVQAQAEQARRRRADLEAEIAELEETIGERHESLEGARDRLADLEADLEALAETVEARDSELTEVEGEIKYLETELEDARADAAELDTQAEAYDRLVAARDDLSAEIEALRNRKDQMKRRTRAAFDEAVADLLSRFDTGFEGARLTSDFDLVVARDGREASLDALSEGELELIGLVAALAGHQAFEVGNVVPVFLLDDLGGLSDDSLHTVVEMFGEHVDRIVLTAYPEHSDFAGHVIDPTAWTVVSDSGPARAPS